MSATQWFLDLSLLCRWSTIHRCAQHNHELKYKQRTQTNKQQEHGVYYTAANDCTIICLALLLILQCVYEKNSPVKFVRIFSLRWNFAIVLAVHIHNIIIGKLSRKKTCQKWKYSKKCRGLLFLKHPVQCVLKTWLRLRRQVKLELPVYNNFWHTYYYEYKPSRHVFIFHHLTYVVQLLYLRKLLRPKFHAFSVKLSIFPMLQH